MRCGRYIRLVSMRNMNRRENPRLDIRLSCHITSPVLGVYGAMCTENISRGGVLIAWGNPGGSPTPPEPGQMMAVEIELPAHHGFGQKCMHCEGSVSRISQSAGGHPCVALRVNYVDFRAFREPGESLPAPGAWVA